MLKQILSLGIIISLTSCMKVQEKGKGETNESEIQVSANTTAVKKLDYNYDFSNAVQRVVFLFPEDWGTDIVVEKKLNEKVIFQREVKLEQLSWADYLSEDSKVNYTFFSKKLDSMKEQFEVIPAINLVVSENFDLVEKYKLTSLVKKIYFQNLEIKNQGRLLIGDYKGEIIIKSLQSDNGTIQTFLENQRAALEKDGRSVGGFKLTFLEGSGHLKLNLFAEAGGDGKNGAGPDEKLTGEKGNDGQNALFATIPPPECFNTIHSICFPKTTYECSTPPVNGGEGRQGLRGYSGTNAGNGGSVEKIEVINQSSQLQISTYKKAGQKGKGGLGGSGGRGGPGGPGGDGGQRGFFKFLNLNPDDPNSVHHLGIKELGKACPQAQQGPTGIRGEMGQAGHDGVDGQIF